MRYELTGERQRERPCRRDGDSEVLQGATAVVGARRTVFVATLVLVLVPVVAVLVMMWRLTVPVVLVVVMPVLRLGQVQEGMNERYDREARADHREPQADSDAIARSP